MGLRCAQHPAVLCDNRERMVIDEKVSSPACPEYGPLGGEYRKLYEKSKVLSEHTWRFRLLPEA